MRVAVPGGAIAVEERGSGVPIVFVHGGTGTGEVDWAAVASRFARHHRTVVMDMRGHGSSHDHGGPFGIVRFGLDALHVLDALGIPRAVLVGFSVGGNALLTLAARDHRRALALVTVGSQMRGDAAAAEHIVVGPWPSYLTELEHEVGTGPEYWRELRNKLAGDWVENLVLTRERLATIRCPALICQGTDDPLVTVAEAQEIAEAIPGGEVAVFEGAGHAVQLDQPDALAETIEDFVRRRPSRR
jgi:3-oxoadipate enol-lactonase